MEKQEKNTASPYELDGRPPLKVAIPLGLQHVLAMFVGNLTPLLIITAACGIEAGGDLQGCITSECNADRRNCYTCTGLYDRTGRWQASYRYGNKSGFLAYVRVLPESWEMVSLPMVRSWQPALSAVFLRLFWEAF